MDIIKATKAYEAWLGEKVPLVDADLRLKHQRMAQSAFPYLRATFYRWVQLWPHVCPELATAPAVLGIGDLHVENFGTWRDGEGRLIWGVNDFDEVALVPYTNDLVRLAVSAKLAISENHLSCDPTDACDAILAGYREGFGKGGKPFVLAEQHRWLRDLAVTVEPAPDGRTARVTVLDNDADRSGERPPVSGAEVLVCGHADREIAKLLTNAAGVAGFVTPADVSPRHLVVSVHHPDYNPRHLRLDGSNLAIDLRRELWGRGETTE